jgi:hypothetical protein
MSVGDKRAGTRSNGVSDYVAGIHGYPGPLDRPQQSRLKYTLCCSKQANSSVQAHENI